MTREAGKPASRLGRLTLYAVVGLVRTLDLADWPSRRLRQLSSPSAEICTFPFNACEIGHPSDAILTASRKSSALIPGTSPLTLNSEKLTS